jgi:tRNA G46 methylase TrmB
LEGVRRLLKVGGRVVLKTDHRGYFEWVLGEVEGMAGYREVGRSWDYWNDAGVLAATTEALWAGEVTRYEGRFRGKRKAIHYLELERRE